MLFILFHLKFDTLPIGDRPLALIWVDVALIMLITSYDSVFVLFEMSN